MSEYHEATFAEDRLPIERRIEMRKAIELRRNGEGNLVICSVDELEALLNVYERGRFDSREARDVR